MLKSMTGYGKASFENENLSLSIEIRTLNSKYFEVNTRLSKELNEKEIEFKSIIQKELERGKIAVIIDFQRKQVVNFSINEESLKAFYLQIQQIAQELNAAQNDLLRIAIQYSDALNNNQDKSKLQDEEWEAVKNTLLAALERCNEFREQEGSALTDKLNEYIQTIEQQLHLVNEQDPKRVEFIREKVKTKLQDVSSDEHFDQNRFEQEMIYYIEKLDISEEKVRLKNHLNYFKEMLNTKASNGKKLGFIAQEIGREINTIGSKANDFTIQRNVVEMKEELEKIKEQSMNIL